MICFPSVKINLSLSVVSKHPDGYHNMEAIFYPIPVRDTLEIIASDRICFTQTGIPVDAPREKNLVTKALNALRMRYEIPLLETHLLKVIPSGARFGGGSADVAFMLKLVDDFCGLDIHPDELEATASTIGADCPFFARSTPVSAIDMGNQSESADLSLRNYCLCLIKSNIAVSIPEAYPVVAPIVPETPLKETIRLPVSEWKERMVDDLERSVFPKHPVAERVKGTLYEGGVLYTVIPGSEPSVFGLFERPAHFKEQSLLNDCFLQEGQLS